MNAKILNVLEKILKSFEEGAIPEALSITVIPQVDVPCSYWSLSNRLIVFFSGSSDCRGFKQWKEVGRFPRKGSKAIYILSPGHKKVKEEETDKERSILTGFFPVAVFRYEDTDGEPLQVPDVTPQVIPPLYDVATKWGISVDWQSYQGDAYGYYSPTNKRIVLATHDEQVFFHELSHASHEKVKGSLNRGQDWSQEIVAELTSAVLGHLYGRQTNEGATYRYIRHYAEKAGKDPYRACLSVVAEVEKCLNLIVHAHSETNLIPSV